MTELSFLIDLLMNHKLAKATKELVAQRIKEVEAAINAKPIAATPPPRSTTPQLPPGQAPSTLALMAKHGELPAGVQIPVMQEPEPVPVEQIAQTPATQAAMARRQQALLETQKRPADPATGRPRKW